MRFLKAMEAKINIAWMLKKGEIAMSKFWIFPLIVALGCSKAQLPLTSDANTSIEVTAISSSGEDIDSAQVFLNGDLVGLTPFQQENLQPGLLSLRVAKTGFQFFTKQLLISEGQFYSVEAVLKAMPSNEGELLVSTNRDSVFVTVQNANHDVVVETYDRISAHVLPAGTYTVSGEKAGFPKVVKAADVAATKTTTVNLDLMAENQDEPPTLEFSIAEDTVKLGEAFNLKWNSDGYQVIIDQGVGLRGPNGSEKLTCPTSGLKVFTATAYGEGNLTTAKKDSVYIVPKSSNPPSLEFSVAQDSVMFGEPVLIQWNSDGYQVAIDHGVGVRGPIGNEEVYFKNPGKKVFTATAYGEDNLLTTRKDSVFVKEAPTPSLPVVMLSTTRMVTVNTPATITWHSQNADYIVVDYVNHPDVQGTAEVTFSTPGIRIVTATAFNEAGYASTSDTIEVVEPHVEPVEDIILPAQSSVRADKGEAGYYDRNAAHFDVKTAGKYRLFAEVWYNSGDSQLNESFYIEIRDEANNVNLPRDPNAGIHFVVPDDPGEPHTLTRACGVFRLTSGHHEIDVIHYAKIANQYPQFLNGPIEGPESVKVLGFKLVYLEE